MFNTKNLSYLNPLVPFLFMLLQLASIAIAIAFPALIVLPFIISIISATFSFSTMTRSNTKTAAAFLVVSVALAILTWGTSSVIAQFGFYGFMHLLTHGPLLLSAIAGFLTSLFFTLYHYIILYQLTSEDAYVKISTYLVRSLVPAAIMGCLALLFGLLLLNIMPLALSTVLIPIPLLAVCGWLAGNFLGLVGVNQV